jgi:hypothetical protein
MNCLASSSLAFLAADDDDADDAAAGHPIAKLQDHV